MQKACALFCYQTSQPRIIDEKRTRNVSAGPVIVAGRQEDHAGTRLGTHGEIRDAVQIVADTRHLVRVKRYCVSCAERYCSDSVVRTSFVSVKLRCRA